MARTSSDGESVSIANASTMESWFIEAIKLKNESLSTPADSMAISGTGSCSTDNCGNLTVSANGENEKESEIRMMKYEVKVGSGLKVCWQLAVVGSRLFVAIPDGSSLDGARESFVSLLEVAEDRMHCQHVVVLFRRERADRTALLKTFMYIGFVPLAPSNTLTGGRYNPDFIYLAYKID